MAQESYRVKEIQRAIRAGIKWSLEQRSATKWLEFVKSTMQECLTSAKLGKQERNHEIQVAHIGYIMLIYSSSLLSDILVECYNHDNYRQEAVTHFGDVIETIQSEFSDDIITEAK